MPLAFSQLDKGTLKTWWLTCNVGFCNEHLRHEEGNEAKPNTTRQNPPPLRSQCRFLGPDPPFQKVCNIAVPFGPRPIIFRFAFLSGISNSILLSLRSRSNLISVPIVRELTQDLCESRSPKGEQPSPLQETESTYEDIQKHCTCTSCREHTVSHGIPLSKVDCLPANQPPLVIK